MNNNCLTLVPIKWATKSELKNLRGVIYRIMCLVNGKCYIGCTLNSFYIRYNNRKNWCDDVDNRYLLRAINKYGFKNFKIQILEFNILNENAILFLERYYASFYKSYHHQNGYNIIKCGGFGFHPGNTVTLIDPTGNPITFSNIRKFCRDNNLKRGGIQGVINKRTFKSQGWINPEVPKEIIERPQWSFTAKHYNFINPNEEIVHIFNLRKFYRENNLLKDSIIHIYKGKQKQHKGWTAIKT